MAELALQSNVVREKNITDAEIRAFGFSTVTTALLPYVVLVAGVVLILVGANGIGFVAVAVGLLSTGPGIIAATRRAFDKDDDTAS